MTKISRWLAVIPACAAAWYLALFVALCVLGVVERFCPPEEIVSGFCRAHWYPAAERAVVCFGAGLSAFFVVIVAAVVAPDHQLSVARLALGSGTIVAAWMALQTGRYLEFVSAIVAGVAAIMAITYISRRRLGATCHVA